MGVEEGDAASRAQLGDLVCARDEMYVPIWRRFLCDQVLTMLSRKRNSIWHGVHV